MNGDLPLPEWPTELKRDMPPLPPLDPRSSAIDVARAYGTLALRQQQQWPAIVDALVFLRLLLIATQAEVRELRTDLAVSKTEHREKMPSAHDFAEEVADAVGDKIEEAVEEATGRHKIPPPEFAMTEERVQKVVRMTMSEQQLAEMKEEARHAAERKFGVALAILGCILAVVSGVLVWALTGRATP